MGSFGGYLLPTKGFHVVGIFPCLVGTTHLLVGTLTPLVYDEAKGYTPGHIISRVVSAARPRVGAYFRPSYLLG